MQLFLNLFRISQVFFIILKESIILDLIRIKILKDNEKKQMVLYGLSKKMLIILPKLGPAFIKAGQFLATRPDLVGEIVSKNLEKMQDRLPACDFSKVRPIIHRAVGIDSFKYIEPIAVAAASIAQVHKAEIKEGELVAIKILRPGIKEKFLDNLALLKFIAHILHRIFNIKRFKIRDIVARIEKASLLEMDFRMEAASADKLKNNLAGNNEVYIPKVFWQYTTENVIVLEWIDGIPLYDRDRLLKAGFNLENIAKKVAIAFFNQAYRDGFFHADLHYGNILINANEQIVFLDFGIMEHLDYMNRLFIAQILKSFLERDYDRVAKLHFRAGYISKFESINAFALACRSIGESILNKPANQVSISKLLKQLFDTARTFNMKIQPQLLLLQKTMVTVEGIGIYLDKQTNIWLLIKPWIKKWARSNLGIKNHVIKYADKLEQLLSNINALISLSKENLTTAKARSSKKVINKKNKYK